MMDMARRDDTGITLGSGNVFADLGFPDAVERQTKVRLAVTLQSIVKKRKISKAKLAERLGVDDSTAADLARYDLHHFSVERLLQFIRKLGYDIDVTIKQ